MKSDFRTPRGPSDSELEALDAEDDAARYARARQMMSDAIDAHLADNAADLRARVLQTTSPGDLHALMPEFTKALVKRVGIEPASPIVTAIDRLIAVR
ncbi:MAG TPA: hypothetical protein VKV24_19755 [Casimicrobiaceae bacterium]|nr:hypothetical protein [Casimicrobiaceae bacterium]